MSSSTAVKTKRNGKGEATTLESLSKGKATSAESPSMLHIAIPEPKITSIKVDIEGVSPLYIHRMSEKARKEMEDRGGKKPLAGRPARNPQEEAEACLYLLDDGRCGIPITAFKKACITAAGVVPGLEKNRVPIKMGMFIIGDGRGPDGLDLAVIRGEWRVKEDVVRLGGIGRPAQLRYRPRFEKWATTLIIEVNEMIMSVGQVVNLLAMAGRGVGVGDWRIEKTGEFGCFRIAIA